MQIVVVIPTYNEAENIRELIEQILMIEIDNLSFRLHHASESSRNIEPNLHILVVDDNSPDGTGEIVEAITRQCSRVHVLHRQGKRGYGSACLEGFQWAFKHNAAVVISMDGDFSHDPQSIPAFCEAIQRCDVVIGSRYLNGIGVVNWPWYRLLLSRLGNLYIRFVTGITVADCTSGFRAYQIRALEQILPKENVGLGYAWLVEILFYAIHHQLKVQEISIVFTDRRKGKSKMSWQIAWESIWMPWRLKRTLGKSC